MNAYGGGGVTLYAIFFKEILVFLGSRRTNLINHTERVIICVLYFVIVFVMVQNLCLELTFN